MDIGNCVRGLAAVGALCVGLGACSKAPPAAEPVSVTTPVAATDAWKALSADATADVVQANRTVALKGGGELALTLSCNFRPSADPVMNGFWMKMDLELKSPNGQLGLDPLTTEERTARFAVVRSTGEAGTMALKITDPTHFVYENNQTNELNNDNNNPAKVELATSFDLPLSDGRAITIQMQKSDPGYTETIARCAALSHK